MCWQCEEYELDYSEIRSSHSDDTPTEPCQHRVDDHGCLAFCGRCGLACWQHPVNAADLVQDPAGGTCSFLSLTGDPVPA